MARVLAIVDDLLLASRVEGSLRSAGHEVKVTGSIPDDGQETTFDAIVVDLDIVEPAAVREVGLRCLGFHSHVDRDTADRAREAGFEMVVPRSRMSRDLPNLVERLLGE